MLAVRVALLALALLALGSAFSSESPAAVWEELPVVPALGPVVTSHLEKVSSRGERLGTFPRGRRRVRRQHHRIAIVPAGAGGPAASTGPMGEAARDARVLRADIRANGLRGSSVPGQQQLCPSGCSGGWRLAGGRCAVAARILPRVPGAARHQLRAATAPPIGCSDHVWDQ